MARRNGQQGLLDIFNFKQKGHDGLKNPRINIEVATHNIHYFDSLYHEYTIHALHSLIC